MTRSRFCIAIAIVGTMLEGLGVARRSSGVPVSLNAFGEKPAKGPKKLIVE